MDKSKLKERLEALMVPWTFPGAAVEPLMPILEESVCAWLPPGKVLCEEGGQGNQMFFLFSGSIEVLKRDRFGKSQPLVVIEAPTLMGHMSLLDRSKRSATCVIKERSYVGVVSERTFTRFSADPGPSGTVFRRLILASLSQQLQNGDERLGQLLASEAAGEKARQELRVTVGALQGWTSASDEADEQWKSLVSRRAHMLPLEAGTELKVQMDESPPFVLTMRNLSPGASERVTQRFIRFLHTIPTPPVVELNYIDCTSSLLQRPQQVSKQLGFYFLRNAYQISGDEEKVTILFPGADSRW